MGNVVKQCHQRTAWRVATALVATLATVTFLPSAASANTTVNLNFSQWWAPQMAGHNSLQNLVNQFEQQNPGIHVTLETAPYPSVESETIAQAATGTMADVVGLDGSWVNPLYKEGALLNLSAQMKQTGFDQNSIKSQVKSQRFDLYDPRRELCLPPLYQQRAPGQGWDRAPTYRLDPVRLRCRGPQQTE